MAAQPLRSRRHPRRTHGIQARPKTLLLRLHWPASPTMILFRRISHSRAFSIPASTTSRSSPNSPRPLRLLCVILFLPLFLSIPARAQNLDNPLRSIEAEITAFSFVPNDAIAFSVYHRLKTKLYDLEHDDIWLEEPHGKRHRLLEGQKYTRGNQLLVQLLTTTVQDDSGNASNSVQTLLFDDSGHEVRIDKGDNFLLEAANAAFLPDNNT